MATRSSTHADSRSPHTRRWLSSLLLLYCSVSWALVPAPLPLSPLRGSLLLRAQPERSRSTHGPVAMSRRSRRRKRGAAAGERRHDLDVERPDGLVTAGARGRPAPPAPFKYLCVLDVEATCEQYSKHYVHEIIEFPVVVVDLDGDGGIVAEFHSYVRPTVNTTLSEFCTRLTGITQEQVDTSPTLPEVLAQFEAWRLQQGFLDTWDDDNKDFAFVADGPWDLRFFLHGECVRKAIGKPAYFDKWVNLKQLFADFYHVRTCNLHKMLGHQGLKFEGRLHSGIDDSRNIARIAMRMRADGAAFYLNEVSLGCPCAFPPRVGRAWSPLGFHWSPPILYWTQPLTLHGTSRARWLQLATS